MNEPSIQAAVHNFNEAVTRLVVDKDGVEGTPTPDIQAVLLSLPAVRLAIEEHPQWPLIGPLRRVVAATEVLLTTLTVVSEEINRAIVIEWTLAWGEWMAARRALGRALTDRDDQTP